MMMTGQRLLWKEWQAFYPEADLAHAEKIPAMLAVEMAGYVSAAEKFRRKKFQQIISIVRPV